MTIDEILNRISERTVDNTRELRKTRYQRRTEFTDLYGIPFSEYGDANNPATFYISISPDMIYHLRLQFRLHIKPFVTTVSGGTDSANVTVNNRSLSVSEGSVSPNPHNHTTESHSHNLISGISIEHTTADDFRIYIDGINITAYLVEQQDGAWIDGEGTYPQNQDLNEDESFYDLMDVACLMYAEGETENAEKLLEPGWKEVKITSSSPFGVTFYLYGKYSHPGL